MEEFLFGISCWSFDRSFSFNNFNKRFIFVSFFLKRAKVEIIRPWLVVESNGLHQKRLEFGKHNRFYICVQNYSAY